MLATDVAAVAVGDGVAVAVPPLLLTPNPLCRPFFGLLAALLLILLFILLLLAVVVVVEGQWLELCWDPVSVGWNTDGYILKMLQIIKNIDNFCTKYF